MKSVLISINPKWCELIASGKKTIEVRKTAPKLETPFKCYIYCTKGTEMLWITDERHRDIGVACLANAKAVGGANKANGKVIGSFVCDGIEFLRYNCDGYGNEWHEWNDEYVDYKDMCLSEKELEDYLGTSNGYGWHISDLKIYDKPKGLSEFYIPCNFYEKGDGCGDSDCPLYEEPDYEYGDVWHDCEGKKPLRRPPQSWCRVVEHALNARYTGWSVLNGLKCHFKEMTCNNERMCGMCINNPPNEEKKNGKKPPLPFDGCYCPSCGEPTYSSEACVFCGQRLIREEL